MYSRFRPALVIECVPVDRAGDLPQPALFTGGLPSGYPSELAPPLLAPPVDWPPVVAPPADAPPVATPPVDRPPADEPPLDLPPVALPPPVDQPPVALTPPPAEASSLPESCTPPPHAVMTKAPSKHWKCIARAVFMSNLPQPREPVAPNGSIRSLSALGTPTRRIESVTETTRAPLVLQRSRVQCSSCPW